MTVDDPASPVAPVAPERGRRYQVAVAGILGPVARAVLAELQPSPQPPSTLLRLQVPVGRTAGDVAAVLQAQGLEILTLRPVEHSSAEVDQGSSSSS